MDNYETGIYTDNPDDTLRYMKSREQIPQRNPMSPMRWVCWSGSMGCGCSHQTMLREYAQFVNTKSMADLIKGITL